MSRVVVPWKPRTANDATAAWSSRAWVGVSAVTWLIRSSVGSRLTRAAPGRNLRPAERGKQALSDGGPMDLSLSEEQQASATWPATSSRARRPAPHPVGPRRVRRPRDHPEDGRDRVLRAHHPRGVRRRSAATTSPTASRMEELGRADSAAARHRVGLARPGRQVDPRPRHRGAEAGVAAAASPPAPRSAASG